MACEGVPVRLRAGLPAAGHAPGPVAEALRQGRHVGARGHVAAGAGAGGTGPGEARTPGEVMVSQSEREEPRDAGQDGLQEAPQGGGRGRPTSVGRNPESVQVESTSGCSETIVSRCHAEKSLARPWNEINFHISIVMPGTSMVSRR